MKYVNYFFAWILPNKLDQALVKAWYRRKRSIDSRIVADVVSRECAEEVEAANTAYDAAYDIWANQPTTVGKL